MKGQAGNLRKAAVLVASLDPEPAEAILDQMSPDQAAAVRTAVETLGPLDPVEQNEVIEEFFRIGPLVPDREPSGIELDHPRCASLSVPGAPRDSEGDCDAAPCKTSTDAATPSASVLHDVSPASLASFLEREQPQTVAVVLSRLSSQRAAEVLAALPVDLQVEAARRVTDLDEMDPAIIGELERGIEAWLCERERTDRRRAAGMTALANILEVSPPSTRQRVLAGLKDHGSGLTKRVAPAPQPEASFADLEALDVPSLSVVLHRAERELLVLALAAAPPEFVRRASETFSPSEAQRLRLALCNLGPTRLSDLEEAQQQLARLAQDLERRGEIKPVTPRHLSVAV
jgi:flagellar motor switch protein FliG